MFVQRQPRFLLSVVFVLFCFIGAWSQTRNSGTATMLVPSMWLPLHSLYYVVDGTLGRRLVTSLHRQLL